MSIRNIEKLSPQAGKTIKPFIEGLLDIYGDQIRSIFAYGSATGSDYVPGVSDINLAVIMDKVLIDGLKPALDLVKKGMKKKIVAPLFLTPDYIERSMDTFPMEFLEMKDSRQVLFGEDLLENIRAEKEDIRRECEYQLKGKLLTIRQAYLEQAMNRKGMETLIKRSVKALMPVFRGVLRIKDHEDIPMSKEAVIEKMGDELGIDVSSFAEVLQDKKLDGKIGGRSSEAFLEDLLVQIEKLSEIVDGL